MSILSLLLASAAFFLLGLATEAHHRRRFGACPPAARCKVLRTGGWLSLVVSVAPRFLPEDGSSGRSYGQARSWPAPGSPSSRSTSFPLVRCAIRKSLAHR